MSNQARGKNAKIYALKFIVILNAWENIIEQFVGKDVMIKLS